MPERFAGHPVNGEDRRRHLVPLAGDIGVAPQNRHAGGHGEGVAGRIRPPRRIAAAGIRADVDRRDLLVRTAGAAESETDHHLRHGNRALGAHSVGPVQRSGRIGELAPVFRHPHAATDAPADAANVRCRMSRSRQNDQNRNRENKAATDYAHATARSVPAVRRRATSALLRFRRMQSGSTIHRHFHLTPRWQSVMALSMTAGRHSGANDKSTHRHPGTRRRLAAYGAMRGGVAPAIRLEQGHELGNLADHHRVGAGRHRFFRFRSGDLFSGHRGDGGDLRPPRLRHPRYPRSFGGVQQQRADHHRLHVCPYRRAGAHRRDRRPRRGDLATTLALASGPAWRSWPRRS